MSTVVGRAWRCTMDHWAGDLLCHAGEVLPEGDPRCRAVPQYWELAYAYELEEDGDDLDA